MLLGCSQPLPELGSIALALHTPGDQLRAGRSAGRGKLRGSGSLSSALRNRLELVWLWHFVCVCVCLFGFGLVWFFLRLKSLTRWTSESGGGK